MRTAGDDTLKYTKSRQGFTIVELLIVVVVIAILASITIVSYNGITKSARNSALQNSLSQAVQKLELFKMGGEGVYPGSLTAGGIEGFTNTAELTYTYGVSSDNKSFCLAASQSGRTYYITSNVMNPKTGICNGAVGVTGTGDVATDGSSSAGVVTYSIFGSAAPQGTLTRDYSDGNGSLKTGNRFYTTENTGIKVTGLRIYNPVAPVDPNFLSLGITAYGYTNDWAGVDVDRDPTFGQSPLATKTFSGTRIAGTWTDILFDTPFTIGKITSATNGADLVTLAVVFAGGNHYIYVAGADYDHPYQSTGRLGTYLAETNGVGRGLNSIGTTKVDAHYGIDILFTPVTP